MSENENPEITIDLLGEPLRVILPGHGWTMGEGRRAKEYSRGLAVVQIEAGLQLVDPDAWTSVLRVSLDRAGRKVPQATLDEIDLVDLTERVFGQLKDAAEQDGQSPPLASDDGESESNQS